MGFGMATHLVKQGYTVKGFDVFPKSVERFKNAGGTPASSLIDSAEGMPYYICMVATAAQAQEVLFDREKGLVKGTLRHSISISDSVPRDDQADRHIKLCPKVPYCTYARPCPRPMQTRHKTS